MEAFNQAVPAAIQMAQFAEVVIGGSIRNDPNGNVWGFPDTESRDLAGRVFGRVMITRADTPNNYQYIKSGLETPFTIKC